MPVVKKSNNAGESRVVAVRLPMALYEQMMAYPEYTNASDFIKTAVREKLERMRTKRQGIKNGETENVEARGEKRTRMG